MRSRKEVYPTRVKERPGVAIQRRCKPRLRWIFAGLCLLTLLSFYLPTVESIRSRYFNRGKVAIPTDDMGWAELLGTVFPVRDTGHNSQEQDNPTKSWPETFTYPGAIPIDPNSQHGPDLCHHESFVVLVKNRPYGFEARAELRKKPALKTDSVPILFFVGKTAIDDEGFDEQKEDQLWKEMVEMKDIVLGDFNDSYSMLRTKEMLRLQFFTEYCDSPATVLIDDDANPNIDADRLWQWHMRDPSAITCLFKTWKHSEVQRNFDSRWATTLREYPVAEFPNYCAGPCFMMGKKTAEALVKEAHTREWDPRGSKSDVYATGIFRTLAGIPIQSADGICPSHIDLTQGFMK